MALSLLYICELVASVRVCVCVCCCVNEIKPVGSVQAAYRAPLSNYTHEFSCGCGAVACSMYSFVRTQSVCECVRVHG